MRCIGLLGGTFNPIHYGHLRLAQTLHDSLKLNEVLFIPSANPPHKAAPAVSAQHRAAMVQLAIQDNPTFKLDTRELQRTGASYTIDTLESLRAELGDKTSLYLLMGSDAFVHLHTWHRWAELLDFCHIVLVQRANTSKSPLPATLETLLQNHYTENTDELSEASAGFITMQAMPTLQISSTYLRECFAKNNAPRYLLPEQVLAYIHTQQLYVTL